MLSKVIHRIRKRRAYKLSMLDCGEEAKEEVQSILNKGVTKISRLKRKITVWEY